MNCTPALGGCGTGRTRDGTLTIILMMMEGCLVGKATCEGPGWDAGAGHASRCGLALEADTDPVLPCPASGAISLALGGRVKRSTTWY